MLMLMELELEGSLGSIHAVVRLRVGVYDYSLWGFVDFIFNRSVGIDFYDAVTVN